MLEFLKAAASISQRTDSQALPQDILSFTIQYATPPDLNVERGKLKSRLESDRFDLFFYSSNDDPNLLILQFPNVERAQSPDFLFQVAQELREAMGVLSVIPDIDPPFTEIESTPPGTEGLGDAIWALCSSRAPSVGDAEWACKLIRADVAAAEFGVSGAGVRVAQPDTGVARHKELEEGIDKSLGFNFVDGTADSTDPLAPSMRSPGHGTSTSSAVASRASQIVTGSAPGATLVPIRAVNSVVIGSGVAVARAIDHARSKECRVVTMSLGGPLEGQALQRAIARAVQADMILVAAAGNCVGFVTYPAWDPDVIAVAAVNNQRQKWRGSCSGPAVDISAPGENVYVARRIAVPAGHTPTLGELEEVNERGQGTSFAVALTAGVAALWLERFGFAAIQAEARRRDLSVQHLFRTALMATAQRPAGWDTAEMGAGIVDAAALLRMNLGAIPPQIPTENGNPALVEFEEDFKGTPFESEASFVAFDWQIRRKPGTGAALESAVPAIPSRQFAERLGRTPPADLPAPAAIVAPTSPPVSIDDALRRLAVGRRGTLESGGEISHDAAMEAVRNEGPDSILGDVKARLDERRMAAPNKVNPDLQNEALDKMERALQALADPSSDPGISAAETRATLEALVKLTGRPAIRVRGDGTEVFDPNLGDWQADLVPTRAKWQRLTNAVGRIDVEVELGRWVHAGTGFVISDGHVMTNRHVLDTFAEPWPAPPGDQAFVLQRKASIIFDPEAANEATRYDITRVVTAGKDRIGRLVNVASLDMAVVAFEPDNGHAPPPPAIDRTVASTSDRELRKILVAGYPAKPGEGQAPSDDDPATFLSFWDRIGELYGEDYGVKYLSPGLIMARPGEVAGDAKRWAFTHDATTLPGNSGSAIISLHGAMEFCGLHFGGSTLTMNLAHDIDRVFAGGDGVFSTAFLSGPQG